MAIAVLYVHHTGIFGGASRSLLELIGGFPKGAVEAHLVTQRGAVAQIAKSTGINVIEAAGISQLDNSRFGYYRGKRWLLLLREIAYFVPTLMALRRARRLWPDLALVHVNELTLLPVIWIARWIFDCPLIVHVRSVQLGHARSWRNRLVHRELLRAAAIIAIDDTVHRSLPQDVPCKIIHNGLAVPFPVIHSRASRSLLRVGMVGNLLGLKGVHEFVEAARLCKVRGVKARFIMFGGNTRRHSGVVGWLLRIFGFSRDVEREIKDYVQCYGLEDTVELAGFNADLDSVYRALDVLCFPSHLDAPGRPVFEAAFWRVPSIVAVEYPTEDTLVHGETGIAISGRDPHALADAITHLALNPHEVERMGRNAQRLARQNYDAGRNARKVLDVYRCALGIDRS